MGKRLSLLLVLLFSISSVILALETNLVAEKIVVNSKGGESREVAKSANPGDTIEYTFNIKNSGKASEFKLQPMIPIPNEMVLIPESISPGKFLVSVDGKNYIKYPVRDVEGKEVEHSAYKAVKWEINELKPSEEKSVKLRAKINS